MKKFIASLLTTCAILTILLPFNTGHAEELKEGWENMVVAWDWQPAATAGNYYPTKILLAGRTVVDIIGGSKSRYESFTLIFERTDNPKETDPSKFVWRINPTESLIGDDTGTEYVISDLSKGWYIVEPLHFDIGNAKQWWVNDPTSMFAHSVNFPAGPISNMKMANPEMTYSKGSHDDMSHPILDDYSRITDFLDIRKTFTIKDKNGQEVSLFDNKDCGKEWLPFSTGPSNIDSEAIRNNCILFNKNDTYLNINLKGTNGSVLHIVSDEGLVILNPKDRSITAKVEEYFKQATHQGTTLCSLRDIVEHKCTQGKPYDPKEITPIQNFITPETITPDEAANYESGINNLQENLPGYKIIVKGPEARLIQGLVDRLNALEDTRTFNDIPASEVDAVLGNAGFTTTEIAKIKEFAPNATNLQTMFEALKNKTGIGAAENLIQQVANLIMIFIELTALCVLTYGGILWITSAGNEERIKKGKTILTYAIIGLVGATILHVIIAVVIQMFTEF